MGLAVETDGAWGVTRRMNDSKHSRADFEAIGEALGWW